MTDHKELTEKSNNLIKDLIKVVNQENDARVIVCSLTTILGILCSDQDDPEKALESTIESMRKFFEINLEFLKLREKREEKSLGK